MGRGAELALVAAMLEQADPATVLHVHGPGGVGKSTLLRQLGWQAEAAGRTVTWVDGREYDAAAVIVAAGGVLLLDEVDALPGRRVEVLEELLGRLPADAVAVLAGRDPPPAVWRTDPGWRSVLRTVRLGNLDAADGRELLRLRGVPEAAHAHALAFTHGHPLALALLADVAAQSDGSAEPATPEVLAVLLDSLIGTVPTSAHLAALEACSQVAVTTEPLLAALLDRPDARELFDWLRELSIIDFSPRGLYPHDVARAALAHELHWRHPHLHARFHGRARVYYERQLAAAADPAAGRRVLFDFAYLHRDSPVLGPFLRHVNPGAGDDGGLTAGRPAAGEWPALRAAVVAHEGEPSAGLAQAWAQAQPDAVTVVRGPDGTAEGLIIAPALDRATDGQRAADPVAAAAWEAAATSPPRDRETIMLVRHWMSVRAHQAVSPVQTYLTMHLVRAYLATPGLAHVYICCADPEFWTAAMAYTDFRRVAGADVEIGGRRYGLFGHDWRAVPPMAWMTLLAGREMEADPLGSPPPEGGPRVLDEAEFGAAVRAALRDVSRPDRLRDATLAHSRLVLARAGADAGPAERAAAVRESILAAAEVLERSPRDRRGYRALHHTYLQPAATQAAAAELLDLPTTTYRRHLASGVARLTELLWQQELGV